MKQIIDLLRRLFGREQSIASITRPITKIVNDLDAYAVHQVIQADEHQNTASELEAKAKSKRKAAEEAAALRSGYAQLLGPAITH